MTDEAMPEQQPNPEYALYPIIAAENDNVRNARLLQDAIDGGNGFYAAWQEPAGRRRIIHAMNSHYDDALRANDMVAVLNLIDAKRHAESQKGLELFRTKIRIISLWLGHESVRQTLKDGIIRRKTEEPPK